MWLLKADDSTFLGCYSLSKRSKYGSFQILTTCTIHIVYIFDSKREEIRLLAANTTAQLLHNPLQLQVL